MSDLLLEKNFIKIDAHCHTKPSSLCSEVSPKDLVEYYLSNGYEAVVLTNHYRKGHIDQFGGCFKDKIEGYLSDYRLTQREAKNTKLKVFLGAEVKVKSDLIATNEFGEEGPINSEFLLYGISEKFLSEFGNLTDFSQKELFELCESENVLMFQSHPYRYHHFCMPMDEKYMHGVEVFNPHFNSEVKKTLEFANKHNLLFSAGSDTHTLPVNHLCGMLIPKDISNQFEFRDYLKLNNAIVFSEDGVIIENRKLLKNIKY